MNRHTVTALFRRNFVSYFSSPIGYVFICAFVLMSAFAAFWPVDFFNANLANLDQLNRRLPWIMLVFVPAITMGIWAEERRGGTDELLLTLPASDFEIVLGKYLGAVAIFTVSLLFSLSNVFVLVGLGEPDLGLLFANYVGYWFTGAAMIAVGAVASFLTRNLTVAFILAVAFNAPLIFAASADVIIPWDGMARFVRSWSIDAQFQDFSRGLITLSSVAYFTSITVLMLYMCMVLIGRRHWHARVERVPMTAHYFARAVALVVIAVGVNVLLTRFDLRIDTTSERLSSLSPRTRALLTDLDAERPVVIEAYVSPDVPEAYVQTRLNLLSMLKEVDKRGGDAVIVRVNETELFSREASEAVEQFGIVPRQVQNRSAGQLSVSQIYMGAAFLSGLDKVVVPFFDRGVPVEYEVVRSIATVSQQERKRIGILATDAQLFGGFDMQSMSRRPDQAIIAELRKQYDVVAIDALSPFTERYDAVLAVQPSSLPQAQLNNLIGLIRGGQPTAVFEDPFPYMDSGVPGTLAPRRPPSNNPFAQQQPVEPKGNIGILWSILDVEFNGNAVVWDDYNPYPKVSEFPKEFVFIGAGSGADPAFSPERAATSGLQQLLAIFPGAVHFAESDVVTATPLMRTGRQSGTVEADDMITRDPLGRGGLNPARRHEATGNSYVLAAHIESNDAPAGADETGDRIDVTLVSDIDLLYPVFFALRARGDDPESAINFDLDNVTFVLNVLDDLAGDDRFVEIRSRRPAHRTLTAVEQRTEVAREEASEERQRFVEEFEAQRTAEEEALNARVEELRQRTDIDPMQMGLEVATAMQVGQNRLEVRTSELQQERNRALERIQRDLTLETRRVQNTFKLAAVALPPIPPLLVGLFVFVRRRAVETLGVPKTRLRGAATGGAA